MRIRSTVRLIVSLSVLTALPPILLARGQKTIEARASIGQTLKSLPGQTVSLLPDGTWLVVGGNGEHGPVDTAAIKSPDASSTTRLQSHLRRSRAWHTATLLPDGTVLVLGGVGADGQITDSAELFHPDTHSFEVIPSPGFTPRAYHTATVLTEGRVLIAGGISNEGETLGGAQLWDPRAGGAITLPSEFGTPRRNHTATLLRDGRVLLWGGVAEDDTPLEDGELFDPQSQTFTPTQTSPDQSETAGSASRVVASIPEDGAPNVPLDTLIALRFSEPLRNATVNSQTVRLLGPEGIVETTVIPAEGGLLAFVTPKKLLSTFALYTVKISGLIAVDGLSLPESELSFTTGNQVAHGEEWIPSAGGDWQTGRPDSVWKSLPPLQAVVGVTALSGQVLRLNGMPLANVTLTVDGVAAKTDRTGRFLLSPLTAGHHEMLIDGGTASQREKAYGFFEVGVDVAGGRTNALPYTIWMPRLDMVHAVTIPSPTTTETVITTPLLPGLELHLPAQTVIRDYAGNVVTKISITPIPLDRPPFPLPTGVEVPIYFTIQPGASYVQVLSGNGPKGARLVYPNSFNAPVKATFDFWNYDPDQKGWYVYGHGRVAADGKQITPDPGVLIYEFTGAMVASPGFAPASGPAPGNPSGAGGEPVDLGTGLFVMTKTDLFLPDKLPISLTRTYRQSDNISRAFGIGATHPYDIFLVGNTSPSYTYVDLILPDGGRIHFVRTSGGTGFADAVYQHTSTPTSFYGSTISWNGNGWNLKTKYGTVYTFPPGDNTSRAQQAALISISDRFGNTVSLARDGARNLTWITSPNGRWIHLTYDASNRVTQAQDNSGRIVTYVYDASGRLWTVTDPNNGVTTYTYDPSNEMLTIKDARQITYLTNQYDANGRVMKQTLVDNSTYQFAYTLDGNGNVTQTNVTDQRGIVRKVTFNSSAYVLTDTYALGKPEQELFTYSRQALTNLVTSVTDPLNRQTSYTYDAMGNLTGVTRLAGTPNAVTTSFAYQVVDPFNQLVSVTDPLGHKTTLTYQSSNGALLSVTDPLGNKTSLTSTYHGLPVTVADPLGNTVTLGYNAGDLLEIHDPLNHTTYQTIDSAGRLVSLTQPGGDSNLTVYNYDGLNQLTQVRDPLNALTQFAFDPNGNLLSVTDALNHPTVYTYDNMDRMTSRKDPLLRPESYQYDAAGNVTQFTDRKGQVTTYAYDSLNRLTFVGFGTQPGPTYNSTINYTYDAGNRVTSVVDSLAGTITPTYDDLDRLTGETTPQGSVTYLYDTAGRRTRMTVAGQPAVNYTYDNDNRLTQITQGTSTASFAYDIASRRTSMTLPNSVVTTYSYDAASELTGLTYKLGSTTLGALTYSYDAKGQRTAVGGSYARTGLPLAVSSATYDAANELTHWGSGTLTYDANGNLTNDGLNTYAWDTRNQLASISASGSTIGTFGYDAVGRRMTKTVGGTSTSFLYDGVNSVQELLGTTPTANLLTGLRVDEVLSRTDSAGARSFLAGALGSTVALTDSAGGAQTQYTYDPFGFTSFSGPANSNSFQYTGRENDGTGAYFYRARYYSPQFGRFISEDPLEFAGGQMNLYGYVGDDPVDGIDPTGTSNPLIHIRESYNAYRAAGYPVRDAAQAAWNVAMVDFRPGAQDSDAGAANWHAMGGTLAGRKDGKDTQDPCEAYSGTANNVVNGDEYGAMHAIEDSYVHQYAPWNGGWNPFGIQFHWPGWRHLYNDLWYNDQAEAAAEAYLRRSPHDLNPSGVLAPPPRNCN